MQLLSGTEELLNAVVAEIGKGGGGGGGGGGGPLVELKG